MSLKHKHAKFQQPSARETFSNLGTRQKSWTLDEFEGRHLQAEENHGHFSRHKYVNYAFSHYSSLQLNLSHNNIQELEFEIAASSVTLANKYEFVRLNLQPQ